MSVIHTLQVAIIAPLTPLSGNLTTANRIKQLLESDEIHQQYPEDNFLKSKNLQKTSTQSRIRFSVTIIDAAPVPKHVSQANIHMSECDGKGNNNNNNINNNINNININNGELIRDDIPSSIPGSSNDCCVCSSNKGNNLKYNGVSSWHLRRNNINNNNNNNTSSSRLSSCTSIEASPSQSCSPSGPMREEVKAYDMCFVLHALRGGRYLKHIARCHCSPPQHHGDHTTTASLSQERGHNNNNINSSSSIGYSCYISAYKYVLIFGGTDVYEFPKVCSRTLGSNDSSDSSSSSIYIDNDICLSMASCTEGERYVSEMSEVIDQMDAFVCFSTSLKQEASKYWERWTSDPKRTVVIPQSVTVRSSPNNTNKEVIKDNDIYSRPPGSTTLLDSLLRHLSNTTTPHTSHASNIFFILPAGLREVKGQDWCIKGFMEFLHLINTSQTSQKSNVVHCYYCLLMVGPQLEDVPDAVRRALLNTSFTYKDGELVRRCPPKALGIAEGVPSYNIVQEAEESHTDIGSVVWIDGLPLDALHQGIISHPSVKLVLNTSRSEGQPQAVLESMSLYTPSCDRIVMVRNNPGNSDVVHNNTGLIVSSPGEMAEILFEHFGTVDNIMVCMKRHTEMALAAKRYVDDIHGGDEERRAYRDLIKSLLI